MRMEFVAVAFWLFLGVAAVAGIVADYKKRRLALEPLRAAIERGQQLDPVIIEKLMNQDRRRDELKPEHLQVGGIITIASGVGLALLSLFIRQVAPVAFYPIMGAGAVAVCIGVGLLIAAKVLMKNRQLAAALGSQT
jgi:Domain of unknown function (DUF6249)